MVDREAERVVENSISRRRVLQGSLAGLVAAPLGAAAAESGENADSPLCPAAEANKCGWTLVRPQGTVQKDFQQSVLHELAGAPGALIGEPTGITVTLQEAGVFSSANVRLGSEDRPVDALLEIETSHPYGAVSKINEYLLAPCDHVQRMAGGSRPRSLMPAFRRQSSGRSSSPIIAAFIRRLDGTTPEHFDPELADARPNRPSVKVGRRMDDMRRTGSSSPSRRQPGL